MIKYEGDKINVKPRADKYKLDDGQYYIRIRVYDVAGNHQDSGEVLIEVLDEDKQVGDGSIELKSIGLIPYNAEYQHYYYASNQMTLIGTAEENTEIKVFVDGNEIYSDTHSKSFKITRGLISGARKVKIVGGQTTVEFTLVVDPTRQSFPESLR